MHNKFLKYDDNNVFLIISLVVSIMFLIITILLIEVTIGFYIFLFGTILATINTFLVYFTGIHINYKKGQIIIFDFFLRRKIKIKDVQYISFEEINKVRKAKKVPFFDDASHFASWQSSSKFVYRKGKTFYIKFHMNNKTVIKSYYGWLYKAKSESRVTKKINSMEQIISEFNKYKRKRLN